MSEKDRTTALERQNYQYTTNVPGQDQMLIDPVAAQIDYHLNLEGTENQNRQLDLFYDYRNNLPFYLKAHEYFRTSQMPLLAAWGKGDPAFIPSGAEDFKDLLPNAQIHLLDAGHFALETKRLGDREADERVLEDCALLGSLRVRRN
ncbi:hypothetical protein LTR49_026516 [Elasticomyces elasticus]|nr:hypothetical protein LTR49_026516 [Elasticomyces elasticus]